MADYRIIYMDIDRIKPAPWNPARRTTPKALQPIIISMREHGFWPYQHLILGRDDVLADGHRRLAAAKAVGLPRVPVMRVDKAADVIWAEINGKRQEITASQSLEAIAHGLSVIPDRHKSEVEKFIQVMGRGPDGINAPLMAGVAPSIMDWARKTARYIGIDPDREPSQVKRIIFWLRRHQMQKRVRAAMEDEIDPQTVIEFINADLPLPKGQYIGILTSLPAPQQPALVTG